MKRASPSPSFGVVLLRFMLVALASFASVNRAGASTNAEVGVRMDAPYAFQTAGHALTEVLRGFAADHGLVLRIGADPNTGWQATRLDGWVRGPTARAFLEQLANAHHFSWFIADRTLYIGSANDAATERIALHGMRADHARAALAAVGLYDARFGWGELTGQDAVLVGGPRAYRALLRRFLAKRAAPNPSPALPEPMIFSLRFAPAGDTAPSDGSATRPGVATLLRQLLGAEARLPQPPLAVAKPVESAPPLPNMASPLGQWLGSPARTLAPALAAASGAIADSATASDAAPSGIVADDRTNAVIVWGDHALRPHLQRLIDALDRASPLVAVDVFVIETDGHTIEALRAAGERAYAASSEAFDDQFAHAIVDRRVRLLNGQTVVGRVNGRITLSIGSETAHMQAASDELDTGKANGRDGNRGDRLGLLARIVPSAKAGTTAIAIDIDLQLAQPTGLPGQAWANTSSIVLDTEVTLDSGAPPRLIASYPVATARAEQRAVFIRAKTL